MRLLDELQRTATLAAEREQAARHALYDEGDRRAHRAHLVAKAELLAGLEQRIRPLIKGAPAGLAHEIMAAVAEIAADAEQALAVDSAFYMAALLHPMDPAEPDELAAIIEKVKRAESRPAD